MKYIWIIIMVFTAGCATPSKQGQEGAFVQSISCGGNSEWLECYKAAGAACTHGFDIVRKDDDMRRGVRDLFFSCK
jgi:hypothetical protein